MKYQVEIAGQTRTVELTAINAGWHVQLDGKPLALDAVRIDGRTLSLLLDGRSYTFAWEREESSTIWLGSPNRGRHFTATVADPRRWRSLHGFEQTGRAQVKAPMAGKVVKLLVAAGAEVERGQGLVVLEAMKMQNEVRSPK
ncbi:MAG: acetyl-CoA carboxylase biotin carboxyl carrier protein subunit, partial [Terriglobales bacterium]